MFDAIGRRGQTKVLSPYRWVPSTGSAAVLFFGIMLAVRAMQQAPSLPIPEPEKIIEVFYQERITTPPTPVSTTHPRHPPAARENVLPRARQEPLPPPRQEANQEANAEAPATEVTQTAMATGPDGSSGTSGDDQSGTIPGLITDLLNRHGGGASSEVVEIELGDVRKVRDCRMEYPAFAKRHRITGEVLVEVTCSADGRVDQVRWLSGPEVFRDAVTDCLKETRYASQPIPFRFRQPFVFSLR